ncbi:MAG TPA: hypothetical protein VJ553_02040 [Candidatus Paceibacterota bacterium]|nr:hypothetical protein [Candidatus Paceibacterota bacterium]
MSTTDQAAAAAGPAVGAIPFTIASRPQARYSASQASVSNFLAGSSFQPIQLAATGWVRYIDLLFTATFTTASAAAVVAGDAPWNLVASVTLTDATGQPVFQPITGYNLYLVNKYLSAGNVNSPDNVAFASNPHLGPEFAYAASGTSGSATFRLRLEFEQDARTGYGCIPNLDSNASLQLKVDYSVYTVAFTGTTPSAATISMRVSQHYYAPVGTSLGGAAVNNMPIGAGDYVETRFETQAVSAAAENTVSLTNRGGLVKGTLLISRAAGVRTAITAASNVGVVLDNTPIFEGIPVEEWYAQMRRATGNIGADLTTSYAPLTAGVLAGLDRGVVPIPWDQLNVLTRDSWLNTKVGSLYQVKITPGASATTLEAVTQLAQVRDAAAFYNRG